ncbi:MAG: chemotaxis protein CheD [bacterium]
MYKSFNKKLQKEIIVIQPGEYFVVDNSPDGIATVLGSCVAVCLMDLDKNIGGMNHFMLPGDFRNDEVFASKSSRYGMFAMEMLINEMMKRGARREKLVAKIFGGAHVIGFRKSDGNIPQSNINFVRSYLEFEEIPVVASDLGGSVGRKIIFLPSEGGKVLVKKLTKSFESAADIENKYKAKILDKKQDEKDGEVTIFLKEGQDKAE